MLVVIFSAARYMPAKRLPSGASHEIVESCVTDTAKVLEAIGAERHENLKSLDKQI
jgi:hypothetical protein